MEASHEVSRPTSSSQQEQLEARQGHSGLSFRLSLTPPRLETAQPQRQTLPCVGTWKSWFLTVEPKPTPGSV